MFRLTVLLIPLLGNLALGAELGKLRQNDRTFD